MKIAFYLDNAHIPGIDFSHPEQGNPGSGACEYLHVAIPFFIRHYMGDQVETILLARQPDLLPPSVPSYGVGSVREAALKAKEKGADFFVFRPRVHEEDSILSYLDEIKLPSIGRAALTPSPAHARRMAQCQYFKALVCVGREQYDSLIDSPLYKKRAYIDNGIHVASCGEEGHSPAKDPRLVAYMGALVPVKGFHVLAEAWPRVLQRFPDAKLSVIGSVKMYGDQLRVGPLGVADEVYEKKYIIPFLCDTHGRVHPSVTFHGQMGKGKFDILQRALVGVPNPTGQTETCCVSAVEMAACRAAVVTGAYYALLDTVHHQKTGLLGRGVQALADHICACLADPARAMAMGQAGYERALRQYDFAAVAPKWVDLCRSLKETGQVPVVSGPIKNIFYHYKLVRVVNSIPQRLFGSYMLWPSFSEIQGLILDRIACFRRKT